MIPPSARCHWASNERFVRRRGHACLVPLHGRMRTWGSRRPPSGKLSDGDSRLPPSCCQEEAHKSPPPASPPVALPTAPLHDDTTAPSPHDAAPTACLLLRCKATSLAAPPSCLPAPPPAAGATVSLRLKHVSAALASCPTFSNIPTLCTATLPISVPPHPHTSHTPHPPLPPPPEIK
ncbi:hypothetical protein BDZ91DRAFT_737884 [Kalaharituber pfeilii]|nr:hypothetical protein BDZ91DRAFT_737884 [Kalaharituber pfeilii]